MKIDAWNAWSVSNDQKRVDIISERLLGNQ